MKRITPATVAEIEALERKYRLQRRIDMDSLRREIDRAIFKRQPKQESEGR